MPANVVSGPAKALVQRGSRLVGRWRGSVPWPVWALSVVAATVAVALALTVFRHGSMNNDDSAYLLQARLLQEGRLTGAMPEHPEAQQPWFFAVTGHGYVPKYLPSVAVLAMLGLELFGTVVPVLAAMAFALPLAMWGLARSARLERRQAMVATAVVALSPAVLVQGGLVLSYLPFLLLLVLGWTALLRVWSTASPRAAAGVGLIAAVAGAFRPLDAAVLLGPAALFVAWRLGFARRIVLPAIAGAAPVGALILLYDHHVTGSATRLPFNLLSPTDAYGYGIRQLTPEDYPHHFGPLQGLHGFVLHFLAEPAGWMLGFALALPLAIWNLRRGGAAGPPTRLIAAAAALSAASYLAFWGPWHASVLWGGTTAFGPFYALPALVPIALASASWWPRPSGRSATAVAVVLAAVLVGHGATVVRAIDQHWSAARQTATVLDAVRAAPGTLLLDVDPPYLAHPVGAVGSEPLGDGRTILLSSRLSPDQVRAVAEPTLLQIAGAYDGDGLDLRLVRQVHTAGTTLPLRVTSDLDGRDERRTGAVGTVLVVSRGGEQRACDFPGAVDLTVTATGVSGCDGWTVSAKVAKQLARRPSRLCATTACASFSLFELTRHGGVRVGAWRTLPVASDGSTVHALTDGAALEEHGSGWISVSAR